MRPVLCILAAIAALLVMGVSQASASPRPGCAVDENGYCIPDDVDPYYEAVIAGDELDYDTGLMYGYNSSSNCRTISRNRWEKDLVQIVILRWHQRVTWCWNNGIITSVYRDTWPEVNIPLWSFDGQVSTNCNINNTCSGRTGGTWTTITTTAQFHACAVRGWLCQYKYPHLEITINGWGGYSASGSG